MSIISGRIKCNKADLDLPLTLLGGQSFRWKLIQDKKEQQESSSSGSSIQKFIGVMYNNFWEIQQNTNYLEYKVHKSHLTENWNQEVCESLLKKYFNLHINLKDLISKWKLSSEHFQKIITTTTTFSSVRLLNQEPFENIVSFICSQNNHIQRISTMIEWLCKNYGIKICSYHGVDYHTFPTLESLNHKDLEDNLKSAKFGYRSKYITKAVKQILDKGGIKWLEELKSLPYKEAKVELLKITGIGPKVADCICLMSLNHLESVPIDTHIFKLAQQYYSFNKNENVNTIKRKTKSISNKSQNITPVLYEKIGDMFRDIYGPYAGWAQLVLFCSDLKKFKDKV